jgi:hypothetical protein
VTACRRPPHCFTIHRSGAKGGRRVHGDGSAFTPSMRLGQGQKLALHRWLQPTVLAVLEPPGQRHGQKFPAGPDPGRLANRGGPLRHQFGLVGGAELGE